MMSLVDFVQTLPLKVRQEGFLLSESQLAKTAAVLESCSQQLKFVINSRTAVNRLPPEIFKIIFEHVSVYYHANKDSEPKANRGSLLISMCRHLLPGLTQVCHRWRDIALHTPSLWGYFDPSIPKNLRDLLRERAAGASLTVIIRTTLVPWLKNILDVDGARVKTLIANNLGWAHAPDVVDFPAPFLRFASIEQANDEAPDVRLSRSLFKGDAPRLSRLHLINISARLAGGPGTFNALTELYIRNPRWAYPLLSLSSILRATPNLIKLLFCDIRLTPCPTPDAPNAPPSIVRLERLEHLEFTGTRSINVRSILKTLVLTGVRTSISLHSNVGFVQDASLLNDIQKAKGAHADAFTTIYILQGIAPRYGAKCS
ncbi:hypothetical protein DAEQUDRAFT_328300 [Daedalea quercina L-15889]|uniref:Uncharacterized protein n=1 Tax=Daedalea quercina L-15889 TaxID=1314783 RepID=A0A165PPX4_9APHY|nr:hypothetical protein DAEQUDRAFT_328300 [Daedalea quercina L-15889]